MAPLAAWPSPSLSSPLKSHRCPPHQNFSPSTGPRAVPSSRPLLLVRSRSPRAPRRHEIEAEYHCQLHLPSEHRPCLFLPPICAPHLPPLIGLVLQELPVEVADHRSPLDANEHCLTPSPPPSPSRHPRGESPIPPQCSVPPRSTPDVVAGRAPAGRR
jgi:hypothetical protein